MTTRETSASSARSNILFFFAVAIALYVAWLAREVLLLLYFSALFAVVLMPVVRSIMTLKIGRWRPSEGVAILLLFVVGLLATVLFCAFAIPPVARDLNEFSKELPTRAPRMLEAIRNLPLVNRLDLSGLSTQLQDSASGFAKYLFFSIGNWAGKFANFLAGIVLTLYFMVEGADAYRWALSFVPVQHRARLDATLQRAEGRMGKWLLGQVIVMVILGATSTIAFLLLHVRYAYALGVLMGLFNLIPVAGALFSLALVILVAAIDSWGRVAGVLIFYAIYAQIENSYLIPRIMKSRVDLAGSAILVALLLGATLQGILGAMISVPTAVLVAVLLDEYFVQSPVPAHTSETKAETVSE